MKVTFKMPNLATTDSAVKIVRWLVEIGQPVQRGQILLEVETDKATMEVESIATGTLVAQLARPGDALATGQPLATFDVAGVSPARPAPAATMQEAVAPVPPPPISVPPVKSGGMFARNRAAQIPPPAAP
jgi:pyruvate dehydrogenase E2 component (dihydrolipoamide acetyltransferase)